MDEAANILAHSSALPGSQAKKWHQALREKRIPGSFLYEGPLQSANWLALHQAFSPARTDDLCKSLYHQAFAECLKHLKGPVIHLAAICAGDAGKDASFLEILRARGKVPIFTAADASIELLLAAHENITARFKGLQANSILMDLEYCSTLPALLKTIDPLGAQRVVTFLGTLHNCDPSKALSQVINAVRAEDLLLVSANLAPAASYDQSMAKILSGYDNDLSRRWFWGAIKNLGLGEDHGNLRIAIEPVPLLSGLKRIKASFTFTQSKEIHLFGSCFQFAREDQLELFYSIRFTADSMRNLLENHSLALLGLWESEFEGVYLCRRG